MSSSINIFEEKDPLADDGSDMEDDAEQFSDMSVSLAYLQDTSNGVINKDAEDLEDGFHLEKDNTDLPEELFDLQPNFFLPDYSLAPSPTLKITISNKPNGIPCPHCDQGFNSVGHLTYHIRNFHSQNDDHISYLEHIFCPIKGSSDVPEELFDLQRDFGITTASLPKQNDDHISDLEHDLGPKENSPDVPEELIDLEAKIGVPDYSLPRSPSLQIPLAYETNRILCPHCQQSFKGQGGLRYHIGQTHSQNGVYHCCWVCASKFKEINNLLTHIGDQHPNVLHNENGDLVIYQGRMRREKRSNQAIASGETRWKCPYCPNVFNREAYLRNHVRLAHSENEKKKMCWFCQADCESWEELLAHISASHPEIFESESLGKLYINSSQRLVRRRKWSKRN